MDGWMRPDHSLRRAGTGAGSAALALRCALLTMDHVFTSATAATPTGAFGAAPAGTLATCALATAEVVPTRMTLAALADAAASGALDTGRPLLLLAVAGFAAAATLAVVDVAARAAPVTTGTAATTAAVEAATGTGAGAGTDGGLPWLGPTALDADADLLSVVKLVKGRVATAATAGEVKVEVELEDPVAFNRPVLQAEAAVGAAGFNTGVGRRGPGATMPDGAAPGTDAAAVLEAVAE
jgi:hypothetical protein